MSTKEILELTGALNLKPRAVVGQPSGQVLKADWSDGMQERLLQHPKVAEKLRSLEASKVKIPKTFDPV